MDKKSRDKIIKVAAGMALTNRKTSTTGPIEAVSNAFRDIGPGITLKEFERMVDDGDIIGSDMRLYRDMVLNDGKAHDIHEAVNAEIDFWLARTFSQILDALSRMMHAVIDAGA